MRDQSNDPLHHEQTLYHGARYIWSQRIFIKGYICIRNIVMRKKILLTCWQGAISRSCQCSTIGITKPVVCAILSMGWCIYHALLLNKKVAPWSGRNGHPHWLSEWSFAVCLMPNNHKHNTLSVSLNKTILHFLS